MTYGLQVFGENGEVVFDTTKITTIFLGTFTISTARGSFTPPEGSQVKQLWVALPNLSKGPSHSVASVWVEGKIIHWELEGPPVTCIYGGYS